MWYYQKVVNYNEKFTYIDYIKIKQLRLILLMTIIPSTITNIVFNNSIPQNTQKTLCQTVLKTIQNTEITDLYNMTYIDSTEGVFEMPKISEWV